MYRIYADEQLIYSPTLYRENYDVFQPKITNELNRADTLTFQMPDTNPNINNIKKLEVEIKVYDDNKRIFRGRVLSDEENFYRQKSIYTEGEIGYLNDVILRPYEYTGTVESYFRHLIHLYNQGVSTNKQFGKYVDGTDETNLVYGKCTVTDPNNYIVRANSNYPTVLEEINQKLIGLLGGYLIPRCEIEDGVEINYIDYLSTSGNVGTQSIRFGENLLDLSDAWDASEIYTVIVPLGARLEESEDEEKRVSINNVIGKYSDNPLRPWGKDYIENTAAVEKYGRIERVVIWDDVTEPENLWNKANAEVLSAADAIQTLEMQALDLHDLGVDTDALTLGEWHRLISVPHGYTNTGVKNNLFQLSRVVKDLQNPDKSVYTFGKIGTNITRNTVSNTGNTLSATNNATDAQAEITALKQAFIEYKVQTDARLQALEGD